mgnify:CR=1 FL=1
MSPIRFNFKTLIHIILFCIVVSVLFGCGGGGESDNTQKSNTTSVAAVTTPPAQVVIPPEPVDYTPDPVKLTEPATLSTELFVEPNFAFSSYKNVIFDVDVVDFNNNPMSDLMLSISIVDNEIVDYDDPRLQDKSLLAKVKTDNNGQIYLNLEIPKKVSNILLELNAVGIENDVILAIDDSGVVMYNFQ